MCVCVYKLYVRPKVQNVSVPRGGLQAAPLGAPDVPSRKKETNGRKSREFSGWGKEEEKKYKKKKRRGDERRKKRIIIIIVIY